MEVTPRQTPPMRCATLAELVDHADGNWVEPPRISEVVEYALPPVGLVTDSETRDYLATKARVRAPARGLARLSAARVYGAGVVISGDGTLIARDVSEDFGKSAEQHWLIGHSGMRPPAALPGETAVVAVNRGAGYCHWLLEELPRLLTLPRDAVDQVITHAAAEPMRTAWNRRGGRENLIDARRNTHLAVGPLWVPGLMAEAGAPTPHAVHAIRDFAAGLGSGERATVGQRSFAGERVYFSRAKAARRRLTNEEELWRALQAKGFTRVFMEDLTWTEQIGVAKAARVIVAPHGAGLANAVFCAPDTHIVEIVNRAYFNPVFWRLAALLGLNYRPVVSGAAASGQIREEQARNKEDFTASVAHVIAALDQE